MSPMSWPLNAQMVKMHGSGTPKTSGQTLPHMPQFLLSFSRFTQAPLQQVSPIAQLTHSPSHRPFLQALPAAQALPQTPQLAGSFCRSLQPAPQQIWPERQAIPEGPQLHLPPWQLSPILHGRLQPPQLRTSVMTWRQPSLQHSWSVAQVASLPLDRQAQLPLLQTSRERQVLPQAPQCAVLVKTSTQGSPSQHLESGF